MRPGGTGVPGSDRGGLVTRAGGSANPFARYREHLTAWRLASANGIDEPAFRRLVEELDAAVAQVDGRGFVVTPFGTHDALDRALDVISPGGVWVKDETCNVSGSHKARHLAGVMLYLRVRELVGMRQDDRTLAIASCGNAALAAAVVARAAARRLDVFVPPSASAAVIERLRRLEARIVVCERRPGEAGDPCYLRFHEAVAAGALAFCCQGPDNAITVEGGETIVREMLDGGGDAPIDRLFVQVGGGALASACVRALAASATAGLAPWPRVHAVQTAGGFPLARAWARVALRALDSMLLASVGFDANVPAEIRAAGAGDVYAALGLLARAAGDDDRSIRDVMQVDPRLWRACADGLRSDAGTAAARTALDAAVHERSAFMWPWEREPRSLAHGILDDETYDWRAVVEGMFLSGGWPVVVGEERVARANALGHEATRVDVDHTGTAGLAGLLELRDPLAAPSVRDAIVAPNERVAVIFSGARR
jgi:threonine dehydratase